MGMLWNSLKQKGSIFKLILTIQSFLLTSGSGLEQETGSQKTKNSKEAFCSDTFRRADLDQSGLMLAPTKPTDNAFMFNAFILIKLPSFFFLANDIGLGQLLKASGIK